jgi:hypothetical protein
MLEMISVMGIGPMIEPLTPKNPWNVLRLISVMRMWIVFELPSESLFVIWILLEYLRDRAAYMSIQC